MSSPVVQTQKQIKEGWKQFISGHDASGLVRPDVLSAWERCRTLGVSPTLVKPERLTDPAEIKHRESTNAALLNVSIPAIHHLYQFLQDASLFASVSDTDGYLLQVFGDTSPIDSDNNILHTAWSEAKMGNNPIGTALHDGQPTQVFGYEHYCMFPHHFSGAGAPIHAPSGEIIGAISITHVTDRPHPHTLAMIVMTAYAIEQQLRQLEANRTMQMAYQHLRVVIDSMSEGLLVLDRTGRISMVNRALTKLTQMPEGKLLGQPITNFIQDKMLARAVEQSSPFTDVLTKFKTPGLSLDCSVTHRTANLDGWRESVLIVSELSRIHRLAAKLSNTQTRHTFDTIICGSPKSQRLVEEARIVAANDSNVLLLGESGTGKDVFAQAIHNGSARRNGPFIPINCGAAQKELISSELFGYEDGAFTGAKKGGSIGKLEYANGGTVFLDEIGEMPLELQPILLRAIEQQVITRVGGKEFIPIKVRIIAATNRDLLECIREGTFRQDLYYRLNVFTLRLPPLRERLEDIPSLASSFLARLNIKYGKSVIGFAPEAQELMRDYPWPGNIRELQNCIERCVALTTGPTVSADAFPHELITYAQRMNRPSAPILTAAAPSQSTDSSEEETCLRRLLEEAHWNITAVSERLGVTRATVYRRMRKYRLER